LEIGLVGCGRWGSLVLRDLVALGAHVQVVARSAESRARAEAGGAGAVVSSPDQLTNLDGAVVVAPAAIRPAILAELLLRGIPVFTEKPLALSSAQARNLVAAADGRLFVMDKWRYHPGVRFMAGIAASGEMGRVTGLHCRRLGPDNPRGEADCVANLLPHDLAIAQEILGSLPAPVTAVAHTDRGGLGGMIATLGGHPWVVIEVSARCSEHTREVTLYLEGGSVRLAGADDHVEVLTGEGGQARRQPVPGEMPLLAELQAFAHHVRGGPPPRTDASEALRAVEVMEELRRLAAVPL
jgi:predicted dehydrogenase